MTVALVSVQCPYKLLRVLVMVSSLKSTRIELRATREDRELIDRAAAALGVDRSAFVLSQGLLAAQKVLADRQQFVLDPEALGDWERINAAPPQLLPGLTRLQQRPTPFGSADEDVQA